METLIVLWIKWKEMVEMKHRLYKCRFNYILSKLVVDLWRRKNPDSLEFPCYYRSSGTSSRIDTVYTDVRITGNIKINHIKVSFTEHYNTMTDSPQKQKLEKIHDTLIILFYISLSSRQLQRLFFRLLKT